MCAIGPNRTNSRRADRGGFTLIEVMIAVIIAGVILTTVYGALSRTLNSKQRAEDRAAIYANGREAVMRIANDIEGALHPQYGDRNYFLGESGGSKEPTIEFVTVNRGSFGSNRARAGRVLVSFFLAESQTMKGAFTLVRQQDWYQCVLAEAEGLPSPLEQRDGGSGDGESDDQPPPPCRVSVPLLDCPDPSLDLDLPGSCARVVGLDFHFFDDSTGEFRDKWNSFEDPTLDRLPAAVKIDLLLADATGNVNAFSTIADIPLALGQPTPNPLGQDAPDPNNPDPNDPNAGLTDPTPGHGGRQ